MKKYNTLGELLVSFRKHSNLSQLDFAALLDVDARTVIRWEKNESLIKVEKEKLLTEHFGIPHQVIRNLNTDKPIPIYFDLNKWIYSLSFFSSTIASSEEFKRRDNLETDRIETLSNDNDLKFISFIQKNQKNLSLIKDEVLKAATKILPELNIVMYSQSGFHAGHFSILPLKYESYLQLRDKKKSESQITIHDLTSDFSSKPLIFYYYSLYASSMDNTYYMMNKLIGYFEKKKFDNYIFAGISYRYPKIDRLKEMGLKQLWEENMDDNGERKAVFLAGNFDDFLFGDKEKR